MAHPAENLSPGSPKGEPLFLIQELEDTVRREEFAVFLGKFVIANHRRPTVEEIDAQSGISAEEATSLFSKSEFGRTINPATQAMGLAITLRNRRREALELE